jgi:hypothetical protein
VVAFVNKSIAVHKGGIYGLFNTKDMVSSGRLLNL